MSDRGGKRGRGRGNGRGRGTGQQRQQRPRPGGDRPPGGARSHQQANPRPPPQLSEAQKREQTRPSTAGAELGVSSHNPPRLETYTPPPAQAKATTPSQAGPHVQAVQTQPQVQPRQLPPPAATAPSSAATAQRGLPKRPGYGREGRPIALLANHFALQIPDGFIHHYDVEITPSRCPRSLNRQIMEAAVSRYASKLGQYPAFDGQKNLFTPSRLPLPHDKIKLDVTLPIGEDREKTFSVAVKHVAEINMGLLKQLCSRGGKLLTPMPEIDEIQPSIQALDIILRHRTSMSLETVSVGRSLYSIGGESRSLGAGREVWFGRYQSVRPDMWTVTLNIDVAATAFYEKQSVLKFLCNVLNFKTNPHKLEDYQRKTFAREIKGLKVEATYLPYRRKYTVVDVTKLSAAKQTFPLDDGEVSTVKDYYEKTHGCHLRYPNLPCLHVGQKSRNVYIPLECLDLKEGQRCIKKLSDRQTADMIRAVAKPAYERRKRIEELTRAAKFNEDPHLKEFGIKVDTNMTEVKGRVLNPPDMECKNDHTVRPKQGAWDMKQESFVSGVTVKKWGILVIARCYDDKLWNFISQLSRISSGKGMPISDQPLVIKFNSQRENMLRVFESQFMQLDMVLVVLEGKNKHYNEVKHVADHLGVCTQCVLASNVEKGSPATISNLCLKINAKLGGINTIPKTMLPNLFCEPVIIFGADVTHPAPGENRRPSIAAVVASMDRGAVEYRANVKLLRNRQEVMDIDQLSPIVKELLKKFRAQKGFQPRRILFFRDGVSEGQFKQVILNEVAAVQAACNSLHPDYKPGITFVVVQKRHHTRLFCKNERDQQGRSGNVPPGTTVDTDITHPLFFDYYQVSHAGIQGTSRPCHYQVLWDDNKFTPDQLQMLSYQLCHAYARCNRSVSYPAPTYYAHHVAFRARYKLQEWEDKNSEASDTASVTSGYSSNGPLPIAEMEEAINVKEGFADTMYFL